MTAAGAKRGARRQNSTSRTASKTAAGAHSPSLLVPCQVRNRVVADQRCSWRHASAQACLDAADVEAGTQGGLHDDARRSAPGDLLHRLPIFNTLNRLQHLWQETKRKTEKLAVYVQIRATARVSLTSSSYGKPLVSNLEKTSCPLISISKLPAEACKTQVYTRLTLTLRLNRKTNQIRQEEHAKLATLAILSYLVSPRSRTHPHRETRP